jgi:hypothetical protein
MPDGPLGHIHGITAGPSGGVHRAWYKQGFLASDDDTISGLRFGEVFELPNFL